MNSLSENSMTINDGASGAVEIPCNWHLMEEDKLPDVATLSDALVHCVVRKGFVDIKYIAKLCGISCADAIFGLEQFHINFL